MKSWNDNDSVHFLKGYKKINNKFYELFKNPDI